MAAMGAVGGTVQPRTAAGDADDDESVRVSALLAELHERKYRVFRRMSDEMLVYRRMMEHG